MNSSFSGAPEPLLSFLIYIESILGKSKHTANEYYYDLKTFYKFLKLHFGLINQDTDFNDITIDGITVELLSKVDLNFK